MHPSIRNLKFGERPKSEPQRMGSSPSKNLPTLDTVKHVDLEQFLGTWFEIAHLPSWFQRPTDTHTTATYSMNADGSIKVCNQTYVGSMDGKVRSAEGRALVVDTETNSKLKVSFFGPFWGPYWILELDQQYKWAMVGEPSRQFFWILSRGAIMEEDFFNELIHVAETKHGYDLGNLHRTIQIQL
jgi:apolipoprotein D and lipocalin family protein